MSSNVNYVGWSPHPSLWYFVHSLYFSFFKFNGKHKKGCLPFSFTGETSHTHRGWKFIFGELCRKEDHNWSASLSKEPLLLTSKCIACKWSHMKNMVQSMCLQANISIYFIQCKIGVFIMHFSSWCRFFGIFLIMWYWLVVTNVKV